MNQSEIRSKASQREELPRGRIIDNGNDNISAYFTTTTFPILSPMSATPPEPTNSAKPMITATKPRPEVETLCSSSRKVAKVTNIIMWPAPRAIIAQITFFAVRLRRDPFSREFIGGLAGRRWLKIIPTITQRIEITMNGVRHVPARIRTEAIGIPMTKDRAHVVSIIPIARDL